MLRKILRRKHRETVRSIALKNWDYHTSLDRLDFKAPNQSARLAIKDTEAELRSGFSGVVSSILISLAIKLAIKYIERWLEDELFNGTAPRCFGEKI